MKLIILDRDGVINFDSPNFIKSPEEWLPIPGSLEAVAKLHQNGFKVAIATNQSGVARGLFDLNALEKIHQKMQEAIILVGGRIDKVFFCPHGPEDNCTCRKPKMGLFNQIAEYYKIDFNNVTIPAIGDSLRDLESAVAAHCKPILVLTGNGEKTYQSLPENLRLIEVYKNLKEAVSKIIK